MKFFIIIITFFLSTCSYSQESEIDGQWKLKSVETKSGILTPEQKDYFLTIIADSLSYNLEVNKCWTTFTLHDDRISYDGLACTELCCDGRNDSISNFIIYNGLYELKQNQLIITTNDSKLFLKRLLD